MKKIIEGDRRVFYEVYEEYHPKLYRYIYKYTQSAYYSEETVQLTFIKLWEKREGLSTSHSLSSQLFRIAKSTLIDLLRKEKIRNTRALSDVYVSPSLPEERIIYKEQLTSVLTAIDELPTQCREVFTLSRVNNLSHKEIGAQLSISPKTVETHISKALKFLRKSVSLFF